MNHHCHAKGCAVEVPPEMLMCLRHWRMVPQPLKRAVWMTYRNGQCDDKKPSLAWVAAADAAIRAVAELEAARVRVMSRRQDCPDERVCSRDNPCEAHK